MEVDQDLPGFRFHPTEEELLDFYLSRVALGKKLHFDIIGTLNIYRHDPWDLPGMAKIGEREWYFFVPRDRKAGSGGRPNRTTERGFWKATGSDRPIRSAGDPKRVIGLKKTLVFYQGRAPRGIKTDWVMNEYRLPDVQGSGSAAPPKEDMVLCKIYRKATPLKELEQRASAMEELQQQQQRCGYGGKNGPFVAMVAGDRDDYLSSSSFEFDDVVQDNFLIPSSSSSSSSAAAASGNNNNNRKSDHAPKEAKREAEAAAVTVASMPCLPQAASHGASNTPGLKLPAASHGVFDFDLPSLQQLTAVASHGMSDLPSLQLPAAGHGALDWLQQDPFLAQLRSPWQDQHCLSPYAHLLYY